jgi:hypothetical protein
MSNKSVFNGWIIKDLRGELERRSLLENASYTFVRGVYKGVRLTLKEQFVNALCDVSGEELVDIPTDTANVILDTEVADNNEELHDDPEDHLLEQIDNVDKEIEEAEAELVRVKAFKRNAEVNLQSSELEIKKLKLRQIRESIQKCDSQGEESKGNKKILINHNNNDRGICDDPAQFIFNGRIMSQVVFKKFQEFQLYAHKVAVFNGLMCKEREIWMNGVHTVVYQIEAKDVVKIWWKKHRVASESVAKENDPFDGQLNRYNLIDFIPALRDDKIASTLCMDSHFGEEISIKSFFTDESLIQGIKNLEVSFIFLFGMIWCGVCDVLERKVNDLMRKQVSESILITKIDSLLGEFFEKVKKETKVVVLGSYKALMYRENFISLFEEIQINDADKIYDLQKQVKSITCPHSNISSQIVRNSSSGDHGDNKTFSLCIFDMKNKIDPIKFSCKKISCGYKHHSKEELFKHKEAIYEFLKKGKTEVTIEAAEFFKVNFILNN